jgi:hypothetical protein
MRGHRRANVCGLIYTASGLCGQAGQARFDIQVEPVGHQGCVKIEALSTE